MSDTVKLIIEIPNAMYESVQNGTYCGTLYKELKNSIPLDSVKALIEYNAEIHEDGERYLMEQWVYDILDGEYEAESERERKGNLPDVSENVHGEWEIYEHGTCPTIRYLKCNRCFSTFESNPNYNFCPNCGADMRGEQNV